MRAKNLAELEVVRFRGHCFLEGTLSPPKLGVGVEIVGVEHLSSAYLGHFFLHLPVTVTSLCQGEGKGGVDSTRMDCGARDFWEKYEIGRAHV